MPQVIRTPFHLHGGIFVKWFTLLLSMYLFAAPWLLMAQVSSSSSSLMAKNARSGSGAEGRVAPPPQTTDPDAPFSRIALGAGFSPLGVNMLAATNLNRYLNLRATGNFLMYTANNISTNGMNVDAKLNLASAGVSLDYYPFPRHGLRFSPGMLFYNTNSVDATVNVPGGTSFTLNNVTYYASSTNPVRGMGNFGLHSQNPAFTITSGWGNAMPRNGGHFSFPFELGVAFVGSPTVKMALTQGQVCDANGQNCVNVATDPNVQANLQQQVNKYKSNIDQLKTYPIVSFGVAYSFPLR